MTRRPYETLSSFQRTISSSLRCKEIEAAYFALEEGGNEGFLLHSLDISTSPFSQNSLYERGSSWYQYHRLAGGWGRKGF